MKVIDKEKFGLIAQVAGTISRSRRQQRLNGAASLPEVVGVKLTNRCNLRCKHCYEWNEQGYHHNMGEDLRNADIPFEILEKVVAETRGTNGIVYLWGGEPLLYRHIDDLLRLLEREERYTVICTNAILLPKHYDVLCRMKSRVELLLALDGGQESNDALRGKGSYKKVMNVIKDLTRLRESGDFQGKLNVHTMISNENLRALCEFVKELDDTGIDGLLLCFPWYISEETSAKMDVFFSETFPEFLSNIENVPSWHAYKYKLLESNIPLVQQTVQKIRGMQFRMDVQFQPDIDHTELEQFLKGIDIPNCDSRDCLTVFSRLDLLPNGKVTSCKHFQELSYGDLSVDGVRQVWNCGEANRIRKIITNEQMPVCSKCNNLYRHSYKVLKHNDKDG